MPRVFISRELAAEHLVEKDATLRGIFDATAARDGITWEEFAVYNFGTSELRALNRALVELVGCSKIDDNDAGRSTLDPALKPATCTFKLRLPRVWQADELQPFQEHVVRIRRRLAPPGVSITNLDRWFLPQKEGCRIAYALDGAKERADRASVAVYASNYCSATVEDDLGFTYPAEADLEGEVLWSKPLDEQATPRQQPYPIDGWKGESTATKGVLKKRDEARYVNVACSPYTVVVRFHKHVADKDARIVLMPFWPLFDDQSKATTASLVIAWSIKGCTRALKHGQLLVVDKTGEVVLRKALAKADIDAGKLAWDAGRGVLVKAKMPYRVQLQVHTGDDEENGVALAAMHTEVRLWVHPSVGADPKKPLDDPQCLNLEIAPFVPAGDRPALGSNLWYGLRLAELGFHPGPVDGDLTTEEAKMALKELQRSYPKKVRPPTGFERQAITGAKSPDTQATLAGKAVRERTLFGEIKNDDDYTPGDLDVKRAAARLIDKGHKHGLILWVDDQHCYTGGSPIPAVCDPLIGLGDYRGEMDLAGDGKVTKDLASIGRPWIPLSARPLILRRDDELYRDTAPVWDDAMISCVGPLRIDWTFTEVQEDTKLIAQLMAKRKVADADKVRTKAFVEYTISKLAYKDDKDNVYVNCPKKHGGLRPNAKAELGDYYKDLFGLDGKSLKPWKAADDSATKSVCCAVHDDLGQDTAKLFPGGVGRSGLYFRPSTLAGDGYRVRAEVRFTKYPGNGDHPNRAALAARYPQGPVAHTCAMRVWRRTVLRGQVLWTVEGEADWESTAERAAQYYRACHVHMIHSQEKARDWDLATLIDTSADVYKDIIVAAVTKAPYTTKARLAIKDGYVWPWANRKHYGIEEIPPDNVALADYREKFLDGVFSDTWDKFRGPILTYLLDRLEKRTSRYRGHLLVQFSSTPAYHVQTYYCSAPAKHRNVLVETTAAGDSAAGDGCHVTACAGILAAGYVNAYRCPTCATDYPDCREAAAVVARTCDGLCPGMKRPAGGPTAQTRYVCNLCASADALDNTYYVTPAYPCGMPCGGYDHPTALNQTSSTRQIEDGFAGGLPLAAVGSAFGATFVFPGDKFMNWAHEMGHHRHMEHAAGAPYEKPAQHDSCENPKHAALTDKDEEKRWDRGCIMGYVDKQFFCGKCVFKNRGWKVETLGMPARDKLGL